MYLKKVYNTHTNCIFIAKFYVVLTKNTSQLSRGGVCEEHVLFPWLVILSTYVVGKRRR